VEELYRDPGQYVAAQQAVLDTFGLDMVLAPFELSLISEAFAGRARFFADQAPNMQRPGKPSIREALAHEPPDPYSTARLPLMLEATRKLAALHKGTVPVFSILPGPPSSRHSSWAWKTGWRPLCSMIP